MRNKLSHCSGLKVHAYWPSLFSGLEYWIDTFGLFKAYPYAATNIPTDQLSTAECTCSIATV